MSENHTPAVVVVEEGAAAGLSAPQPAEHLGSLADVLKAGLKRLEDDKTHTFDMPGWAGQMRLVARKFKEHEIDLGNTVAKTIYHATDRIEIKNPDGEWVEVDGGWRGVAALMDAQDQELSDVINRVLDNPARAREFSAGILAWMTYAQQDIEHALGE